MLAKGWYGYLPPTHEPYLPLLPSRKASPPFGWYSYCLPTEGWPGWVDLGGWLYTEIGFLHRELNPGPVTHPSTNQARSNFVDQDQRATTMPNHKLTACINRHQASDLSRALNTSQASKPFVVMDAGSFCSTITYCSHWLVIWGLLSRWQTNDKISRFCGPILSDDKKSADFCMSHDRFYRLILSADISAIYLAVELVLISPRKSADFYCSSVIGLSYLTWFTWSADSSLLLTWSGDVEQLRSSQDRRKMSSPALMTVARRSDDSQSSCSDDRLSPLSFTAVASRQSGRRQPTSRASFSTLDQLPSEPSTPLKKLSSTPKSSIPRPSSTSKLPLQRKSVVSMR